MATFYVGAVYVSAVKLFSIGLLLAGATALQAEEIRIPIGSQGAEQADIQRPQLGWSSRKVLDTFGEPEHIQGPVGQPPISQWHYKDFVVYLEGDIVLHAVIKHRPKRNTDSGE
ncbi:MAG: hypothetical protein OIF35_08920 [Cellvibrionaceae bacterium]|nr:hypothetical protein [Cellvibrionaceae bacterium]MCV6627930.1 hypothetical protein [Cellvibrionaceae bacterium]